MAYPDNPFIGQEIEVGGTTKQWNGYAWVNITNGNKEGRLRELEALANTVVVDTMTGFQEYPADVSPQVLAALAIASAQGKAIAFLGKKYKFSVQLTTAVDVLCIKGFEAEPASTASLACLHFRGTESPNKYALFTAALRNSKSIQLNSTPTDISVGDFIVLQDDKVRQSDGAGEINMEVHEVVGVTGNTLELRDTVREIKNTYVENVYKIDMLEDIKVVGFNYRALAGSIANIGILYDMCKKVRTVDFKARNGASDAVSYRRCYDVRTDDWDVAEPMNTGSGQGYGIAHAKGTRYIHVGKGKAVGMRHSVDFDSCYDVTSDLFQDIDATSGGVLLAHNGYGGNFTGFKFKSRGAFQSAYISQNTVAGSDAYTKPVYNFHVTVHAELPRSSGAYGFYSEQAIKDSRIVVYATHGDGGRPTAFVSNTSSVRIPSTDCQGTTVEVNSNGAICQLSRIGAAGSTDTRDMKARLSGANMYHAALIQNSASIDLELDVEQVTDKVITYSGTQTLRRFNVKGTTEDLYSNITDVIIGETSTSGCVGKVELFDSANDLTITMTAGGNLNQDQILRALDGEHIRLTATTSVTMDAARPIVGGLFTGQRLTITHDQNGNSITIPHTVNCQNFGGAAQVLDVNRRSISYVFDQSLDRWYQVS